MGGLHRRLGTRHIQLVAIGGSIGTALFVSIGTGLYKGGPASLIIAFTTESLIIAMLNNCLAEMSTYMAVPGGFIGLAGKWCDDAFGFMAGWNFFIYMALTTPFEITAVSVLLQYWRDDIPHTAVILVCIALYSAINLLAVGIYGEAEFWLSEGKVMLIFILFTFTFITMVGENPTRDAFGFRSWNTGGAFAEYSSTGSLGRFEGFLGALWIAVYTCTVYWRFGVFFIVGATFVGILIPHNDPTLVAAIANGETGSAASPYIIAMKNMGIKVLPDFATALMITSVFSAGNTYTYAATRALHSLAVEVRAPRLFSKTTKSGIPIYSLAVVLAFACLAFLQLSGDAMQVLDWLVSLTTANIIIDYTIIAITYINFYHACQAQNFDRSKLPYYGRFQPYCSYVVLAWMVTMATCFGYESFTPWSTSNFFLNCTMVLLAPIIFVSWKVYKKTRWLRPKEVDLIWEAERIAAYEAYETEQPIGFWRDCANMFNFKQYRRDLASHAA
ncbi:amino acid permease/ SLC12A domain-containing protein [Penicillium malachiteum]|uniref:Amino acid permease/ SLC12A domain-containing protein n=1 Tax=Penicillium malachiteum TaxID=1324776 RepID=A0AAD6HK07_9EURO|nr:amino acid permease/ SLC12A domain-containing protein [Penicillium malachiteum]